MSTHLLIDGYNFFKQSAIAALSGAPDLESGRRYLLDELWRYKKQKNIRITVVFDGTHGSSPGRKKESYRGVDVVYSKQGETADEVIMETIRAHHAGLVIVTYDRAIIDVAKKHAVPFITPARLEAALAGGAPDDEDRGRPEKKGNPRKAPKGIRRARRAVKKI
jgi:predicted RNA-binding protein with PIN domain